ncbi:Protein of unknown function [Thermobacillus xylanilyticus]|nr:Protein of unknown function [Thermobacillus xylanilyticus]
MEVHEA